MAGAIYPDLATTIIPSCQLKKMSQEKKELMDDQKQIIKDACVLFDTTASGFTDSKGLKVVMRALGLELNNEDFSLHGLRRERSHLPG